MTAPQMKQLVVAGGGPGPHGPTVCDRSTVSMNMNMRRVHTAIMDKDPQHQQNPKMECCRNGTAMSDEDVVGIPSLASVSRQVGSERLYPVRWHNKPVRIHSRPRDET